MTWEEIDKARLEGTWLAWAQRSAAPCYLIQVAVSHKPMGGYIFRKRQGTRDIFPVRCQLEALRVATAKDLMELDQPPIWEVKLSGNMVPMIKVGIIG